MGEIAMRNTNLREFRVRVNLPSPIWQVRVLICSVSSPIRGLPNPTRQFVPMISHIRLYPPHRSHLHPSSLFLVHNSTIIAEHKVKSSLSISPCHDHELRPSTSIHRGQHTPNIICLPFILMVRRWPLDVASASGMPPYIIDCHQAARHERWKENSPCHIPTFPSQPTDE